MFVASMGLNRKIISFEELFKRHYSELVRHAYALMGDLDAAEDIVQETFLALVRKRVLERGIENVVGYLHRAVHNNTLYWMRREKRRGRTEVDAAVAQLPVNEEADTEARELESALLKRVEQAMETLPAQQQAAFRLVYVEQRKYHEAADALGVSLNTLKTNLRLAMRNMRHQLKIIAPWVHPMVALLHYFINHWTT